MENPKINKIEQKKSLLEKTREEFSKMIKAEQEKEESERNPDLLGIDPSGIDEEMAMIWNRIKTISNLEEGRKLCNEIRVKNLENREKSKSGDPSFKLWAFFSNKITGPVGEMELKEMDRMENEKNQNKL